MNEFNKQMEMVLYHSNDGDVTIDAYIMDETLWITQKSMAELFGVNVPDISKHLKNIYKEGELKKEATVSKMEIVQNEGGRKLLANCLAVVVLPHHLGPMICTAPKASNLSCLKN